MLGLKNIFAESTTVPSPAEPEMPTLNDPDKAVKRWELEQGRTRKSVETLTAQQVALAEACEQAQRALGARLESGDDGIEAIADLTRHEAQLRGAGLALKVAEEKDRAAQTELLNAKRHASIEKEYAALAELKCTLGPEVDAYFDLGARLAAKVNRALAKAQAAGAGGAYNNLANPRQEIPTFMGRAWHTVTGSGFTPDGFMRFKKWSDSLPPPETARTRPRS